LAPAKPCSSSLDDRPGRRVINEVSLARPTGSAAWLARGARRPLMRRSPCLLVAALLATWFVSPAVGVTIGVGLRGQRRALTGGGATAVAEESPAEAEEAEEEEEEEDQATPSLRPPGGSASLALLGQPPRPQSPPLQLVAQPLQSQQHGLPPQQLQSPLVSAAPLPVPPVALPVPAGAMPLMPLTQSIAWPSLQPQRQILPQSEERSPSAAVVTLPPMPSPASQPPQLQQAALQPLQTWSPSIATTMTVPPVLPSPQQRLASSSSSLRSDSGSGGGGSAGAGQVEAIGSNIAEVNSALPALAKATIPAVTSAPITPVATHPQVASAHAPAAAVKAAAAVQRELLDIEIRGMDYERLCADPELFSAFLAALGEAVGAPGDSNAIRVKPATTGVNASGLPHAVVVTVSVGGRSEDEEAALLEHLATAASEVDGIAAAADGAISAVALGHRREAVTVVSPQPTQPLAEASAVAAVASPSIFADDPDVCEPGCIEGQGVCEDKICFCRTPFTGLQCEKKVKGGLLRFSYSAVAFATAFAALVGSVIGMMLFRASLEAQRQMTTFGEAEGGKRSEVWKPAAR